MNGFYIKELVIKGNCLDDAKVSFNKGLNVINGPSNTGKSFIVQCIDFMFGAESLKKISQIDGYEKILLEIRDFYTDIPITLIRPINKSKMYYYLGTIDNYANGEIYELKIKHDANREDNISKFLLKAIGIDNNKFLVSNAKGVKKTLSFRGIAKLSIITETDIISENKSPVYDGIVTNNTYSKSLFRYLLTQKDDIECEEIEDKKIRTVKLEAKIEYANEEIKSLEIDKKEVEKKLSNLSKVQDISDYEDEVATLEKIIENKQKYLKTRIRNRDKLNNKRNKTVLLIDKFNLLKKQYKSDLERLSFIQDGSGCLDQININYCPVCNSQVKFNNEGSENVIHACTEEMNKTKKNLAELNSTIDILKGEEKLLYNNIDEYSNEIEDISREISTILNDKLNPLKKIIRDTVMISSLKDRNLQIDKKIIDKKRDIEIFNEKKKEKQQKLDYNINASDEVYSNFCISIKKILKDWKYTDINHIRFDSKNQDIVISNEKRISNGKGFRAYFYSAFVMALVDYLIEKEYPYTRVVILDSPLTTLKEEELKSAQDGDIIEESLQDSMFIGIANNCENKQVIIIENKEIPKEIENKCNHIAFTKNKNEGRYGFIPLR